MTKKIITKREQRKEREGRKRTYTTKEKGTKRKERMKRRTREKVMGERMRVTGKLLREEV